MFFVRIAFFLEKNNVFDIKNEKKLFKNKEVECVIKVDRRFGHEKVTITYGPFDKYKDAECQGEYLFNNVKKTMARNGVPIDFTTSLGELTEYGEKNIKMLLPDIDITNKIVENEVLGMSIHKVQKDISEYIFICQETIIERKWSDINFIPEDTVFDSKLNIAYSLINLSNLTESIAISFVLKISAVEALISDKQYRDALYRLFIDRVNKQFNIRGVMKTDTEQINSESECEKVLARIKCDIGSLKISSIGEKCNNLIGGANLTQQYSMMSAEQFFKICYNIRSNFIHVGTADIEFINNNLHILHKLAIDVLEYYENKCYLQGRRKK